VGIDRRFAAEVQRGVRPQVQCPAAAVQYGWREAIQGSIPEIHGT